ncbi:YqaA family protein [Acetonema longum]|uniref:Phosphoesterase PA-phosphatase related protein n=1 Tax=Acetonema longum DSM 6540 TaxID=1009370 RepID=F7NGI0_9FIRM|nr:YqaA family protein [Acetonema longum]EGO64784.1 phosphoesterase PA-phosphatase related protein [Acetonema longum DSM 6540]
MEFLTEFFQSYGLVGLFIVAFVESFISPILPDVVLIPMALANPEQAIFYSVVATVASVLGGFVGYFIGARFGIPLVKKMVPAAQVESIRGWITTYGGWAIFLAAMAPIPYKFVSISAGVFRVNIVVFVMASALGRAKRFVIEGVLIYLYGNQAVELIAKLSDDILIGSLVIAAVAIGMYGYKKWKQKTQ